MVDRTNPDPYLKLLLEIIGSGVTLLAPLYAGEEFFGVLAADFVTPPPTDVRIDRDLHERLSALADQTTIALQNAQLLEQVGHLAWHDSLTGLPNRRLLQDRVEQELERARRVNENCAVFFIDLDRFKHVNDSLGHRSGDELLRQVATRDQRAPPPPGHGGPPRGGRVRRALARAARPRGGLGLAERLVAVLHDPYELEGRLVHASASIGIALWPEHGETHDELLSHADEAMYRSKAKGRDTYHLFGPDGGTEADRQLVEDLQRAVERDELFVLYQPYIDLQTNDIAGVEALVRWRHPDRGRARAGHVPPPGRDVGPHRRHRRLGRGRGLPPDASLGGRRGSRRRGYRSTWPPSTCSIPTS